MESISPQDRPVVFVAGATGTQGGALARLIRQSNGWTVHSTARNVDSQQAQALQSIGVKLFPGDWDNLDSLIRAMTGCTKLWICPATDIFDADRERRHADQLVRAAISTGTMQQVVISTSIGLFAHKKSGILHHAKFFDQVMTAKRTAEQAVVAACDESGSIRHWTFVRPGLFMTNFCAPQVDYFCPGLRTDGVWRSALSPGSRLALVEPADIAKVAAVVLQDPERYHGRAIGVASDVLSINDALKQLGEVTGRIFKPLYMSDSDVEKEKDSLCFTISERSLSFMADEVDIDELRSIAPLTSFVDFLRDHGEQFKDMYRV